MASPSCHGPVRWLLAFPAPPYVAAAGNSGRGASPVALMSLAFQSLSPHQPCCHGLTPAITLPSDSGGRRGTGMKEGVRDAASAAAPHILSLSHVYYHKKSRHSHDLSTLHKLQRRHTFTLGPTSTHIFRHARSASHTATEMEPQSGLKTFLRNSTTKSRD